MSETSGLNRFQVAFGTALLKELQWPEVSRAWVNHIFGKTSGSPRRQLDARGEFTRRVLFGWWEITLSFQTLRDVAACLGHCPPQRLIPRQRYLRFLVESYYNELYVLGKRIEAFTTILARAYKADSRYPTVRCVAESAAERAQAVLSNAVRLRNTHVHSERLRHAAIDRLDSLSYLLDLAPTPLPAEVIRYREQEYVRTRAAIRVRVTEDNEALSELLDLFCDELFPLVFAPDGLEFAYPSRGRGRATTARQQRVRRALPGGRGRNGVR